MWWWDDLRADVRFGLRMVVRQPGVSLLAILCLTVGIGANASVMTWIEGILLRPFAMVQHQDRMMAITGTESGVAGAAGENTELSWPDFQDLAKRTDAFDWFVVDRIMGATLSLGDRASVATGSIVSANYFDAVGVRPLLGRGFTPDENYGRNAHPVTVISYQLWQDLFKGDPNVVGRTQILNGIPHTIVGVMPEGFKGTFVGWAFQFWVPVSMQEKFDTSSPGYKLEDRSARWIEGYARLKPGVSAARAQQELTAAATELEREYPEINRGRGVKLFPLWQTPFNGAGVLLPTLEIALSVAVCLLLIACANVSNLLLMRALRRRHELTVRLSIGASRRRLIQQLLTEGMVISALSALGGFAVAYWCRNLLVMLLPRRGSTVMNLPGQIDWRVLALGTAVCALTTLLVGLAPALRASKVELATALKSDSVTVAGQGRRNLMRSGLLVLQVALSFVLLTGAGLLIESLRAIENADPGFNSKGVLTTWLDLATAGYDANKAKNFQDDLVERLRAVNGVQSVAFARKTPFTYRAYSSGSIATDLYHPAKDEQPTVNYNEVGPEYFSTLQIPFIEGRAFVREDDENAPLVAVVNDTMARKFWPGRDPLGDRLQVNGRWMQVVGVVKTAKYGNMMEPPTPFFYVPMRQNLALASDLNIRASLSSEEMTKTLAREMKAIDPSLLPHTVLTMEQQISYTSGPQKAAARMISVLGGLAILLTAIGLYSVLSYSVTQRKRELAIRVAVGADRSQLLRLVVRNGMTLTAIGLGSGLAAALGTTRLLGYLLYRVSPRDPVAFGTALGMMIVVAMTATVVPAWRASRIDPIGPLHE